MRAAVFTDYGEPLEVRETAEPSVAPHGVLVEVEACGICRSDWHAWRGDWTWRGVEPEEGHVLGHEPAGVVTAVGDDVTGVGEGDHVAVPFNLGDGTCRLCRSGHSNICENRLGLGFDEEAPGAFAEYVHVPHADHNAIGLPEGVSSVDMAGLGCRFMTAFHAFAHRADISAGDRVAVHGCGGVGLSAVHIADALGATVVGVDLHDEKLELARELGASETVNASDVGDVPAAIEAVTGGGADVSMDALGIETTARNSVLCLDRLGQHVQVGMTVDDAGGDLTLPTDRMILREIELVTSSGMPPPRYDEIFRMVADGKLDPAAVVSGTVALEETAAVLDSMTDYETVGISVIDEF